MHIKINYPTFKCPENMVVHLTKVFDGEYELPYFPQTPPTVLDLGANCGAFSVWASHRWPGCEIFAYEPHHLTFVTLRENLKPYPKVHLHNYAIGTPGFRPLFNGANNCGEGSLHHMLNNPAPTGQHVEVKDPLTLPKADVLKMDIEGSEIEVLRPLLESGRTFSAIMFEYHAEDYRRELDSLLKDYWLTSSKVESIIGRGVCCYLHRSFM